MVVVINEYKTEIDENRSHYPALLLENILHLFSIRVEPPYDKGNTFKGDMKADQKYDG